MKQTALKVGLIGLGTVGSGVCTVLARNQEEIVRRTGRAIELVMVADLNTERARALVGNDVQVVAHAQDVITRSDIDVVIELIGGCGIAKTLVLQAIAAGKHVVTANKALLAMHGDEIFSAARDKGVMVMFEAAVAGGIPIIKTLREGLTANRIEWVAGIINGTTNFILSEMRDKGLSFAEVLKQAQQLGYAEADPTFDIEGVDAAHKITLMASMAFGIPVQFDKTYVEGITQLQAVDIRHAEELGYRIKLLGIARRVSYQGASGKENKGMGIGIGTGIELRVHPTLISSKTLLANVEGAMNAIMVQGDAVGTTLYYGKGAGAEPTASAVIADVMDLARLSAGAAMQAAPALGFQPGSVQALPVLDRAQIVSSFYVRLRVADQTGVLAQVTRLLAEAGISVDALIQKEAADGESQTDLIILTHNCQQEHFDRALRNIQNLPSVLGNVVTIRKEEL